MKKYFELFHFQKWRGEDDQLQYCEVRARWTVLPDQAAVCVADFCDLNLLDELEKNCLSCLIDNSCCNESPYPDFIHCLLLLLLLLTVGESVLVKYNDGKPEISVQQSFVRNNEKKTEYQIRVRSVWHILPLYGIYDNLMTHSSYDVNSSQQ